MTTNQSKVEPLAIPSAETEHSYVVKSLTIDGTECVCRIANSGNENPPRLMVDIKSVFLRLFYIPENGEVPPLTFDDVLLREWVRRDVVYDGKTYSGIFEKDNYENLVEEVEEPLNLDITGAVLLIGCGSDDDEKGIVGPVHIDNAPSVDDRVRIYKGPVQDSEEYCLKARYDGVNYSLYHIPQDNEPLTLTFEEAAKSSWRFRDVVSRGEVDKAIFIQDIYKKEDDEESIGPFRIVATEEPIDLFIDENLPEDGEEDERSVTSLEPFDRDMLPSDEDYAASQQNSCPPFPSKAELNYPQQPDESEDYFSVQIEQPYVNTDCIQNVRDLGFGNINFQPEDEYHPFDEQEGLTKLQQLLNIKETKRPKTVNMGEQDLGIVLAGQRRKKNRVQYVVQRAAAPMAAPIGKVKAMREEMTETQNLTAGYCICFLISVLIVVGCSYGLLALLMNPPSFLSEMP